VPLAGVDSAGRSYGGTSGTVFSTQLLVLRRSGLGMVTAAVFCISCIRS
ncbi:uncharacterized protein METZ01_LOCUS398784, partial [marine metagenome]